MDWQQQDEEHARWYAEGCPSIWGTYELTQQEREELNEWLDEIDRQQRYADNGNRSKEQGR